MKERGPSRVARESVIGLDVIVVPVGHRAVHGRLLDMSATGAGVAVPVDERPALEDGGRVVLVIGAHQLDPPITTSAVTRYHYEEGEQVQIGFRFVDPEALMDHLSESFRNMFNARRAPRVRVKSVEPITVAVSLPPDDDAAPERVDAQLADISATGLSLELPVDAKLPVEKGVSFCLVVRIPDSNAELPLTGTVRDRVPLGDRWRIGIEFDADATPDFEALQAPIRAYVERRRQSQDE